MPLTIGQVEILKARVYETPAIPGYGVIVNPGTYKIMKDDSGSIYFHLKGFRLRPVGFERLWGDSTGSTYILNPSDKPANQRSIKVVPVFWTLEEFEALRREAICNRGPEQRMIITLEGE